MGEKKRYLLIGYQRSGTTVSHLILKGHPQISALDGELRFQPFFTQGLTTFTGGHLSAIEKQKGHSLLFNAITSAEENQATLVLGAKTVCNHSTTANVIVKTIQDHLPDLKIVIIRRDDLVAQYGSTRQHVKTGIAHSWYQGAKSKVPGQIKINKWLFYRYVIGVIDTYKELRVLGGSNDVLEISYEKFLENKDEVYRNLLNFLELPYVEPTWLKSEKLMPHPSAFIKDYDHLYRLMGEFKEAYLRGEVPQTHINGLKVYSRLSNVFSRKMRKSNSKSKR